MRSYVSNADLVRTLESLISKKDEDLVRTYQAVVSYRFVNKKLHPEVEQMLFMPRRLMLGFINICLILILLLLIIPMTSLWSIPALIGFLLLVQIYSFVKNALKSERFMPYVYIDEMFQRNILVLCRKKPGN